MSWNIEPQQMLYVTAIVAIYGAILSTFNFIKEQNKEKIKLEITASNGLIGSSYVDAIIIEIVNNSSFEIQISSVGFVLDSKEKIVFMPDVSDCFKIPDYIPLKQSSWYPIKKERIKELLNSQGINNEIRLKPFVMVNGKLFSGRFIKF